ncbi:gibberellin-regulated protein 1-like [Aristolochia californica]|uniref:gibberellin-regulated protein 1-like n=1 Tax=Aristolochia californica TaxID=171875 RepID=UPI0035D7C470
MAARAKELVLCFFIFFLLVQVFAEASLDNVKEGGELTALDTRSHYPKKINCHFACAVRCRKSSRKKFCSRACGTCCQRCKCVPPGTYGNHSACHCYASLKTHGGRRKCP